MSLVSARSTAPVRKMLGWPNSPFTHSLLPMKHAIISGVECKHPGLRRADAVAVHPSSHHDQPGIVGLGPLNCRECSGAGEMIAGPLNLSIPLVLSNITKLSTSPCHAARQSALPMRAVLKYLAIHCDALAALLLSHSATLHAACSRNPSKRSQTTAATTHPAAPANASVTAAVPVDGRVRVDRRGAEGGRRSVGGGRRSVGGARLSRPLPC